MHEKKTFNSGPTNFKFVYDRNHPPLFFFARNKDETYAWNASKKHCVVEYHKTCRKISSVSHQSILSNGMTMGELAMFLVTDGRKR